MKISIVGAGYVGLVSSICFAELGHSVKLIELEKCKVEMINSGKAPIYEKGLQDLLSKHIHRDFEATSSYDNLRNSDITFICVGTPSASDGSANLSMVELASRSVGAALRNSKNYHVVAVKSTVPPGTTQNLLMPLVLESSHKTEQDVGFVVNPEFLREGRAVQDFMCPDRIVIGSVNDLAGDLVESVYGQLKAPNVRTGLTEAEMIKYASIVKRISFYNFYYLI